MATSLTAVGNTGISTQRVTLGTAGTLEEFTVPGRVHKVSFQFADGNGRLTHTGTDGGAIGSDYLSLNQQTLIELRPASGPGRRGLSGSVFFLAGDSNGLTVEFLLESF